MAYATVLGSTFVFVLFVTARRERQRRGAAAPAPPRDSRTALGDALIEGLAMIGAVAIVIIVVGIQSL